MTVKAARDRRGRGRGGDPRSPAAWAAAIILAAAAPSRAMAGQDDGPAGAGPKAQERAPVPVEVVEEWFPEECASLYRAPHPVWFPVWIALRNKSDAPQRVRIEGTVTGTERAAGDFRAVTTVEVQPGTTRGVTLHLRCGRPDAPTGSAANTPGAASFVRVRAVFAGPGEERIFHERRYKAFSLADSSTLTNMAVLVCGDAGGDRTAFLRDFSLRSGALRNLQSGAATPGGGGVDRWSALSISADPVAERMLPADALGYHGIDALILGDADDLRLEPEQVRAIRDWVYLGGRVIFAPSKPDAAFASRLARALLPGLDGAVVRAEDDFAPLGMLGLFDASELEERSPRPADLQSWVPEGGEPDVRVTRVDPRLPRPARGVEIAGLRPSPRSEVLRVDRVQAPLYREFPFGEGRVGYVTIQNDPSPGGAALAAALWRLIFASIQRDSTAPSRWRPRVAVSLRPEVVESLKKGLSSDLGLWFYGGMILLYLLIVGPGIYFLLRRLKRLPWVIWLEPVVIVAYVGVIYLTGTLTRGVLTQSRELSVLHWRQGEPMAHRESFLGVVSSGDRRYEVRAAPGCWLQPVFTNAQEAAVDVQMVEGQPAAAGSTAGLGRTLREFRLDIWQTGVFLARSLIPVSGGVRVSAAAAPGVLQAPLGITVVNESEWPIRRGFYPLPNGDILVTDAVAPGQTLELSGDALGRRLELSRTASRAGAKEDEGDEAPGDDILRQTLQDLLRADVFSSSARPVFIAEIERRDFELSLAEGASLAHRLDLLAVYP